LRADDVIPGSPGALVGKGGRLANQELGAAPGHEHSRVNGYPQAAELRPAEDVFQGKAADPPPHHLGEIDRCACRGDEQPCLVLGEHTTGGT
jgi:hypothetical protein